MHTTLSLLRRRLSLKTHNDERAANDVDTEHKLDDAEKRPPPYVFPCRPRFEDLPLNPSDPKASAWGLYGPDDELGTLNLLTLDNVLSARQEIQLGEVIPLNLPLSCPLLPMNPARKACAHNIIAKGYANDDELSFNTQASSHWDGLRHYGYQSSDGNSGQPRYYNGSTQADFTGASKNGRIGIQNIARHGIAARGVLLDWHTYAQRNNIAHSPFSRHAIPLSELLAVAAEQHVVFKAGDILLIRTGWTEAYLNLSADEQLALAQRDTRAFIGVEASREMIQWHWDRQFAAVVGDTNAYEVWPPAKPWGVSCHEVFLGGWGMPIGEVWDLERLAVRCEEVRRWTFFLTSCPLNLEGGVASPANVLAIL